MTTAQFLKHSEAALFVATLGVAIWTVIRGAAFGAALAGFIVGLSAVSATRSIYEIVWRSRHRRGMR